MTFSTGSAIKIVNETGEHHDALITVIHGHVSKEARDAYYDSIADSYDADTLASIKDAEFVYPAINVVYVSSDEAKRDPYGHQLERLSSLSAQSAHTAHGRFYFPPAE